MLDWIAGLLCWRERRRVLQAWDREMERQKQQYGF